MFLGGFHISAMSSWMTAGDNAMIGGLTVFHHLGWSVRRGGNPAGNMPGFNKARFPDGDEIATGSTDRIAKIAASASRVLKADVPIRLVSVVGAVIASTMLSAAGVMAAIPPQGPVGGILVAQVEPEKEDDPLINFVNSAKALGLTAGLVAATELLKVINAYGTRKAKQRQDERRMELQFKSSEADKMRSHEIAMIREERLKDEAQNDDAKESLIILARWLKAQKGLGPLPNLPIDLDEQIDQHEAQTNPVALIEPPKQDPKP
jgi:hypothetical protein